ncbi:hypothetical protein E2C01_033304 [Portunus trituberculatus]|uniref:Uncharacterized protein n=1 Tax=Portunus trituberculatus TaxID=210409 RepID=A0A5B7F330_PORTR|nr:hypothetical protein [Portunus trituberculatus]
MEMRAVFGVIPLPENDHKYGVLAAAAAAVAAVVAAACVLGVSLSAAQSTIRFSPLSPSLIPPPSPATSCLLSELPAASVKGLGSRSSF